MSTWTRSGVSVYDLADTIEPDSFLETLICLVRANCFTDYPTLFVRVARLRSISLFLQRVISVCKSVEEVQEQCVRSDTSFGKLNGRRCVLMCVGSYNRLSTSTRPFHLWHSRARQNSVYREVAERVNIVIPLVRLWVDDSL